MKVRFQHTSGGDPEGFRARVALLAEDLSDSPPLLLRRAVVDWVREQPFLPTAADLIRLMREALEERDKAAQPATPPSGYDWAAAFCNQRNASLPGGPETARPIEWFVDATGVPKLRHLNTAPPPVSRVNPGDVPKLNRALAKFGASFRYDERGYDYDVVPGDEA